jgi:hypothetical protein
LRALLPNLIIYIIVAILLQARVGHSTKYFFFLSHQDPDPVGVFELALEEESIKITQITYLEDKMSALHKNILDVLLKAEFIAQENTTEIIAYMDNIELKDFSRRAGISTYIEKFVLKKIYAGKTNSWSLQSVINNTEDSIIEFNLRII